MARTARAKPLKISQDIIVWQKRDGLKFAKLGKFSPDEQVKNNFFYYALVLIFLVFFWRLFVLTVIDGGKNRELAENNRVSLVKVEAPRGKIFDREGVVLAFSQDAYFLQKDQVETEISPQTVQDLTREGLASLDFEGELGKIIHRVERVYPLGEKTSHVLGYIGQASQTDLAVNKRLGLSDSVGRDGVEDSYDDFLSGVSGQRLIEVDAAGKKVSILGRVDAKSGRDITLTLDSRLQGVAYDALLEQIKSKGLVRGAMVVTNPNSGEVLALVSLPAFDPSDISVSLDDKDKPLFNRITQGTYPPGSIFKIVPSLSGLESGKITSETEVEDVGEFEIGGTRFANWYFLEYGKKEGKLKLVRAIARSNDIFFFRLAQNLGLDGITQMAKKLGFGQRTGIDLPAESFGLVPDAVFKKSTIGQDWFLGDTLHLGIGQGFMLATPLQINSLTSFMASGKIVKPHLVSKIGPGDTISQVAIEPKVSSVNVVKEANLEIVRLGMRDACKTGGTGFPFFDAKYEVGCKTGTAEKSQGNPHAWFTVYAPYENPQIALTIIIEDGGEGSSVAAPVARKVLDWYFRNARN